MSVRYPDADTDHERTQPAKGTAESLGVERPAAPLLADTLLTPEAAAARLKVSAEHIRALIRSGGLAAINIGTGPKRPLYRITESALDEFLATRHALRKQDEPRRFKRLPPVEDHFPHLR